MTLLAAGFVMLAAGCMQPGSRPSNTGTLTGQTNLTSPAGMTGTGMTGMTHEEQPCQFTPALSVHCGRMPTTSFDKNGRLWAAYVIGEHVYVAYSDDVGAHYSDPVQVTGEPEEVYTNGENRAKVAFGRNGEIYVTWTQVTDGPFYGDIRFTRSTDGGRSFEPVKTVNDDGLLTSHRFDSLFVNSKGDIYVSWLDKRDLVAAGEKGMAYTGAALYYAVSTDNGASFHKNLKVADYSCECCRVAMSETPDGNVAAFWRHIFGEDLGIRDHAFAVLGSDRVLTPAQWATQDYWHLEGCPHHGPSMVTAGDDSYDITWFTLGDVRKGIFYGRYHPQTNEITGMATIATTGASHPFIARAGGQLYLVWKQFDGTATNINLVVSNDEGRTWQPARTVASTADASDHPLLITRNDNIWLSWHTGREGLRIMPLNQGNMDHSQMMGAR
jgi:hypothetical protein